MTFWAEEHIRLSLTWVCKEHPDSHPHKHAHATPLPPPPFPFFFFYSSSSFLLLLLLLLVCQGKAAQVIDCNKLFFITITRELLRALGPSEASSN